MATSTQLALSSPPPLSSHDPRPAPSTSSATASCTVSELGAEAPRLVGRPAREVGRR